MRETLVNQSEVPRRPFVEKWLAAREKGREGGSVIIANTAAGQWFLYGGAVCALLGVASALVTTARSPSRSRTAGRGGSRA